MISPIYYSLSDVQSALVNTVVPQLRAVTVEFDKTIEEIVVRFYYDGEISDELFELASVASAEICHPEYYDSEDILRLDYPEKLPIHGKFAYLRYEPILPLFERENRLFLLSKECPPLAVFQLDMQEALLGRVTVALRFVSIRIDLDEKKLVAHFVYDGEISERDFQLASAAIEDSRITFPEFTMESFIERVDFPNEFKSKGARAVYLRREWECIDNEIIYMRNNTTGAF